MKCGTCRFFTREDGATQCRRMPPMPFPVPVMSNSGLSVKGHIRVLSAFAPVDADQWCGEYETQLDVTESDDAH